MTRRLTLAAWAALSMLPGTASAASPVAVVDQATTFENLAVTIDVLGNDTDADGDPLSVTSATAGANGTTAVNGDDTITYTPSPGFTGTDTFTYTTSDGSGTDVGTVTVTVWEDAVPPTVAATLSAAPNARGWHAGTITVSFTCDDLESGVAACSAPASVTAEGESVATGTATDHAGNTASVDVAVKIDTTAPILTLDAPAAARRGGSVDLTAAPADAGSGIDYVRFTIDGEPAPDVTAAPFTHTVSVSDQALAGSSMSVDVLVADLAGNTASTVATIDVLTDGFVTGEVYDASRGTPLAGATVDFGTGSTTSDAEGRYRFSTDAASATVRIDKSGYTTAERVVDVDTARGTSVPDAFLTPEDAATTSIDGAGGSTSDTSDTYSLTIPAGALAGATDVRITAIAPHALRGPLPLGWSPLGSASIGPAATSFAVPASLTVEGDASGLTVDLVRYDSASGAWVAEALDLTGGQSVTGSIPSTGDYAFVVADTGATAPPPGELGQALLGADRVDVAFGLSATSEVTPSAAPVGAGVIGDAEVVLSSPVELPSGTPIAARVEETYESTGGAIRRDPYTREIPLYRYPLRPDSQLHGNFPVAPVEELSIEDVLEGALHVDVDIASESPGALVGTEGGVVHGTGNASLTIPAGSLAATTAVRVDAVDTVDVGFTGLTFLGGLEVDLSGASLTSGATATLDVGTLPSPDPLFAATYVDVSGQRRLALLGAAAADGTELSTAGVEGGGTYLFFQSDEPLALVSGTVTEIGGPPAENALVESSTTPFVDVTSSTGAYLTAAKLAATTITARSLVDGDQGTGEVTPLTTSPVTLDVALTATGPYVTSMTPADGELGVPTAPAITAEFSEAVNPASVTTSSFQLRVAGGAAVPGRVILGAGNRSASFLPDTNLDPVTSYDVELSGAITDTSTNALLPLTVSFTTMDTSVASYDPDEVKVTFPDAEGNVTVTAPAGVFEPSAFVTIQNVTKGIVVTGDVDIDGSFTFAIQASITDELEIRILSSDEREFVIEKTEYIAADGRVAIGTKGGKITKGEFTLAVPEGAMSAAGIFELTEVTSDVIDALPLPVGAGGKGAGVEVTITGGLEREADLAFPIPPGAPPADEADFAVVRVTEVDGVTIYETVDSASIVDGKATTDSFPFPGLDQGGTYQLMWYQRVSPGGKSPMGVITGIAQETDGAAFSPVTRPLAGVTVSVDKPVGFGDGDYVATTDANGRFVLYDADFGATGGLVDLVAKDASGREVFATALEDSGLFMQYTSLSRYNKAGDVVFNFPLEGEPPPPTSVKIRLYQTNADGEDEEIKNGIVEVAKLVKIVFEFTQPVEEAVATVSSVPVASAFVDERRVHSQFLPTDARSYRIEINYVDANDVELLASKSFLAAVGGGTNTLPLDGPPAIVSDASVPTDGARGISLDETFSFLFTEPVTGVSEVSVKLLKLGSVEAIPLELIGTGPEGVKPVEASDVITALTARPLEGLEYATDYTFQFEDTIVDTGTWPVPEGLDPGPTSIAFETFDPTAVPGLDIDTEDYASTALGDILFVANRGGAEAGFGVLEAIDLGNPSKVKPLPERDSEFVGTMIQETDAEAGVYLDTARPDVLAVLTFETFSGNTGLTLFDVTDADEVRLGVPAPFPYLGFVTTTLPGEGYGADLALHERYAYVASGQAGLQVVDIGRARELFLAEGPEPLTEIPLSVRTELFTRGRGFGQAAMVASAAFAGEHVVAVQVGETAFGKRAFVGLRHESLPQFRFGTVDVSTPFAPATITAIDLSLPDLEQGWPNRIALTRSEDTELAVVVGGVGGEPSLGRMSVVDVTDPATPAVVAIQPLEGSWGSSVTVGGDGTVYVGTPEGLEAYSLVVPAEPKLVGVFPNLVGDVATANGLIIAGNKDGGMGVSALDVLPVLEPSHWIAVNDGYQSVDNLADLVGGVVPPDFEIETAEILFFEDDLPIGTLVPVPTVEGPFIGNIAKGFQLPRPAPPEPPDSPWVGDGPDIVVPHQVEEELEAVADIAPPPRSLPPPEPGPIVPPTATNGARLILNRGLSTEKASEIYDLNAGGWIRPLVSIDTGRVNAAGIPTVRVKLDVDLVNGTSCVLSYERINFRVGRHADVTVSLIVDGEETEIHTAPADPAGDPNREFSMPIGKDDLFLSLLPRESGRHTFRVKATLKSDPEVTMTREGVVEVVANTTNVLPVGSTFVKGVSILDGHLVASSTDASIPGRGPSLDVVRTYGSGGSSEEGPLGAGWNLSFHSRLVVTGCYYTIIGGDGTGQKFVQLGDEFVPQRGYHTSLRRNDDGSYDFFTKGRIRYHYVDRPRHREDVAFGGRPNLDYIEDTNGNRLQLSYDQDWNIVQVQEIFAGGVEGRSLSFDYIDVWGEPRISEITGPLGLQILYEYDEWANLVKVTRGGRVERYEYSVDEERERHNLVAYTDPNGNRTEYGYYADGDTFPGEGGEITIPGPSYKFEWVQQVREGAGTPEEAVTRFAYDFTEATTGRFQATVTDARNEDTSYVLNKDGSPLEITEPGGVVTTMEWAVDDITKLSETNALGRVTRFEYDDNANLTKETIEAGGDVGTVVTEFDYHPTFNKMELKRVYNENASGMTIQETRFDLDGSNGNLLRTTDAENNVTEYTYVFNGDLQSVLGPRPGQQTSFDYDLYGNPTQSIDALGNVTTSVYDERSRLVATSDTFGRSTTQVYDGLDRVTQVMREDASGSSDTETVTRTYYPGGQVQTETNGLGLTTTFTLDALNRVVATADTLGYTTAKTYDGNGNVLTSTDRRGVVTTHTYDELNRLTRIDVAGPFGAARTVATMDYDALGNKLWETDLHGSRVDFGYDELYRLTERHLPTDPVSHVERFTYDTVGNKLTESDANGNTTTYVYDLLNRPTQRTDAVENVATTAYDEAGNPIETRDVTRGLTTETDFDFLNRPLEQRVIGESFTYTTRYLYDDPSHTVTRTDPRGFDTVTVLDAFDRVHRVEQDTGDELLVTTSFYDAGGNVRKTIDPEGRETDFTYDGLNRLTRVDYPLALSMTYAYDGEGNKTEAVDRRGIRTTYDYDNLARVTRTETEASITGVPAVTTVTYDDALRTRVEVDARNTPTTFEMDEQGRVVTITDALGGFQTFEYDGVNKTAEEDKRRLRTSFEYDGLNRVTKVTNALNQSITTAYDDAAKTVMETDRRGIVKLTQLDELGRLVSVNRSGITLEQHEYDGNNNRTRSLDANGNRTELTYDGANRLIARTDAADTPLATTTTFNYDRAGNLLEEKDGRPTGRPFDVKNTYDALNRLESVEDALGNVTTYEYDGEGNRTAQVEPKSASHRTEYDYGELGELIEVRMADGGIYRYEYDENRNRTTQTDAEGNVVTFSYDELNRVDLMTQDPGGLNYVTNHDYDANGNETKLTDPKGQVIDFDYDELNRLKKKTYNLTAADFELLTRTHAIDYHYDANDNLIQVDELKSSGVDPPAPVSSFKTYDTLDRLESETDVWAKTLTYGYDPQGNRTSLTDPDSVRTEYTFDGLNRLETLTLEAGTADAQVVTYEYFPNGLKKSVDNPNGTASTYTYDAASRMTSITHTGPTGVVSAYVYDYDENGNRKSQIETNAGRTETTLYGYDTVNRLNVVTYEAGTPTASQVTYTYDLVGNRLTEREIELETSTPTKDLTYAYDAINRLETITDNLVAGQDVTYAYDANGNTLTKTKAGVTTEFLYDIRDQLGEVRQDVNVLGRYGYDYENLRILKIGDEGIRRYTYDQLSVITESNTSNVTVSKYDYGLDQLVSLNNTIEGHSFFHLDFLGSTVSLTDGFGATRQSILYDAWGNERERVGLSTNKFTFTGHEKDEETGLIYAKARFYDPDIGRFLTQDRLLGASDNPPSLHRYFYTFSNPLRFVDLDGFRPRMPRTAEAMLDQRINEIHQQTGAPKWLIGLKLAGDLSAVGYEEQVFGSANVMTLGGAGGVRQGLEDGTISAQNGFFENAYGTGESYLSGNVDFIVPGAAEYRAARAQGAERKEALVEGAGGAIAVPEWKELTAPDRTAGERFDAGTGILFKYLRLYIIGRLVWGARGGATVETEGTTQNRSVPQSATSTAHGVNLLDPAPGPTLPAATRGTGGGFNMLKPAPAPEGPPAPSRTRVLVNERTLSRTATEAPNPNSINSGEVKRGIYEFPDQTAGEIPYVGQSGNIPQRLRAHERAGRLSRGSETTRTVEGDKTAREIAEHQRIQELTDGVPARQSPNVSNKVDPIGPKRQDLLQEK